MEDRWRMSRGYRFVETAGNYPNSRLPGLFCEPLRLKYIALEGFFKK
jgi:hypothetical protein